MAQVIRSNVCELVTVTGTGPIVLAGLTAGVGYTTFASAMADGDTTWIACVDKTSTAQQFSKATYSASAHSLTISTIYQSSNAGSQVNFPGGECFVYMQMPASLSVAPPAGLISSDGTSLIDTIIVGGTWSAGTLDITNTGSNGTVTSVDMSGGTTGLTVSGGPVTTAGTFILGGITFGTMASENSNTVAITGGSITGMPTPSGATDVAIKSYVDGLVQGLQIKPTATVATAAALPTNTYSNGTLGVGATITITATGTLTVDGHVTALNDLVLVKNEVASANNGLYLVTVAGAVGVHAVLTRSTSMNVATEFSGAMVPVDNIGTANANSLWLANPTTPVVVGTTAIPFTQLNGATDLVPGAGVNITGNTVSNTGVISLGGGTGTISLGSHLTLTGSTLDATGYLTSNQTITLSGAVTGTGATAIITSFGTIAASSLLANSGTASAAPAPVRIGPHLTFSGGTLDATGFGGAVAPVQVYSSTQSVTLYTSVVSGVAVGGILAGAVGAFMQVWGAGGGGGGALGNKGGGSYGAGGAGAGGGGYDEQWFSVTQLPSTVTVTIPAGGLSGAGGSSGGANAGNGGVGGAGTATSIIGTGVSLQAGPGGGGGGAVTTHTSTGGGGGGSLGTAAGGSGTATLSGQCAGLPTASIGLAVIGGSGGLNAVGLPAANEHGGGGGGSSADYNGVTYIGGDAIKGGAGGGAGGPVNNGTPFNGSSGGVALPNSVAATHGIPGSPGAAGTGLRAGSGGAGGDASGSGAGGAGGAGGFPGGGGGGGGVSFTGYAGGAGGLGGGACAVITPIF